MVICHVKYMFMMANFKSKLMFMGISKEIFLIIMDKMTWLIHFELFFIKKNDKLDNRCHCTFNYFVEFHRVSK